MKAATGQISKLRKENATHRIARNGALRESHALRTIVKAHSIGTEDVLTETALGNLSIVDGKVDGTFDYTAPKLIQGTREVKKGTSKPVSLTQESVDKMSIPEINKRWDEVSEFMSA